jgi:hypothetical protein
MLRLTLEDTGANKSERRNQVGVAGHDDHFFDRSAICHRGKAEANAVGARNFVPASG